MAGGGKRGTGSWETGCVWKGAILSAPERAKALELRRARFGPAAIARALGRSVPVVAEFLKSPEAKL
ncbi:hypothetical protein [Phenylobacterium sp.]|uniref:hypothetical protein n=1 Tax=Phenylobacterium sp. TaxID=1871053 RepID=UPI00301B7D2E